MWRSATSPRRWVCRPLPSWSAPSFISATRSSGIIMARRASARSIRRRRQTYCQRLRNADRMRAICGLTPALASSPTPAGATRERSPEAAMEMPRSLARGALPQGMKTAETVSSRRSRDAGRPSEMRHRVHEEGSMLEIMRRLGTATSSLHRGMKDRVDALGELLVDAFHYLPLFAIGATTVGSAAAAFIGMAAQGRASLGDILLLFIYLEIGAMVGIYFKTTRLPVRYLIYVAITALGRVLIEIVGA